MALWRGRLGTPASGRHSGPQGRGGEDPNCRDGSRLGTYPQQMRWRIADGAAGSCRWDSTQRPPGPRAVPCRPPSRNAGTWPALCQTVSATPTYGFRRTLRFPPGRRHLGTGSPSRRPPAAGCAGRRPAFQAVPAVVPRRVEPFLRAVMRNAQPGQFSRWGLSALVSQAPRRFGADATWSTGCQRKNPAAAVPAAGHLDTRRKLLDCNSGGAGSGLCVQPPRETIRRSCSRSSRRSRSGPGGT